MCNLSWFKNSIKCHRGIPRWCRCYTKNGRIWQIHDDSIKRTLPANQPTSQSTLLASWTSNVHFVTFWRLLDFSQEYFHCSFFVVVACLPAIWHNMPGSRVVILLGIQSLRILFQHPQVHNLVVNFRQWNSKFPLYNATLGTLSFDNDSHTRTHTYMQMSCELDVAHIEQENQGHNGTCCKIIKLRDMWRQSKVCSCSRWELSCDTLLDLQKYSSNWRFLIRPLWT